MLRRCVPLLGGLSKQFTGNRPGGTFRKRRRTTKHTFVPPDAKRTRDEIKTHMRHVHYDEETAQDKLRLGRTQNRGLPLLQPPQWTGALPTEKQVMLAEDERVLLTGALRPRRPAAGRSTRPSLPPTSHRPALSPPASVPALPEAEAPDALVPEPPLLDARNVHWITAPADPDDGITVCRLQDYCDLMQDGQEHVYYVCASAFASASSAAESALCEGARAAGHSVILAGARYAAADLPPIGGLEELVEEVPEFQGHRLRCLDWVSSVVVREGDSDREAVDALRLLEAAHVPGRVAAVAISDRLVSSPAVLSVCDPDWRPAYEASMIRAAEAEGNRDVLLSVAARRVLEVNLRHPAVSAAVQAMRREDAQTALDLAMLLLDSGLKGTGMGAAVCSEQFAERVRRLQGVLA